MCVHACACKHPQVHGHKSNATGHASALSPPGWQPDPGAFRTAPAPEASGAGREASGGPASRLALGSDVGATQSLRTYRAAQGNPAGLSRRMLASRPAWALGSGHGVGAGWARVLRGCFFLLWARAPPSPGPPLSLPLPPSRASCGSWSDQGPPGLFS